MKRIKTLLVLLILILPFIFSSCETEEEFGKDFAIGIPETGRYFKIQVDDIVWQGDDFPQMQLTTDNLRLDFIVCTDYDIRVFKKRVYINAVMNDDGSFSNYSVQYIQNKVWNDTGGYFDFEEWMIYQSGALKILKNENGLVNAKFTGKLKPPPGSKYRDEANVIIYFQEFPINPVSTKDLILN